MIKVIAEFFIPEDKAEHAIWLAQDVVKKTRMEEGCISYEVYQASSSAGKLIFMEEWESQTALDSHGKTMHFLNFIPRMKEIQTQDPVIEIISKVI